MATAHPVCRSVWCLFSTYRYIIVEYYNENVMKLYSAHDFILILLRKICVARKDEGHERYIRENNRDFSLPCFISTVTFSHIVSVQTYNELITSALFIIKSSFSCAYIIQIHFLSCPNFKSYITCYLKWWNKVICWELITHYFKWYPCCAGSAFTK